METLPRLRFPIPWDLQWAATDHWEWHRSSFRGSSSDWGKFWEFWCWNRIPCLPPPRGGSLGWKRGPGLEDQVRVRRIPSWKNPWKGSARGRAGGKNRWKRGREEIKGQSCRQMERFNLIWELLSSSSYVIMNHLGAGISKTGICSELRGAPEPLPGRGAGAEPHPGVEEGTEQHPKGKLGWGGLGGQSEE